MTIKDCIDIVDNVKPNQYTVKDKVMWLSFLDEIIINEVLKTHEGYDGRYDDFEGYTEDKLSVPLIVPSPYDRLYTAYLKMQIDKENGEMQRYNNSQILYNTYLLEYKKHYNKTHMPLDITKKESAKPIRKATVGLTDAEYENLKKDLTFILTEYFADTVSEDKVSEIVTSYMQTNAEMLKGKDGYTPKKGVDYFTEEEIEGFKADAKGDDGYSPVVAVTETAEGHNVIITDEKGTKQFAVLNGKDGVSPTITTEETENGHKVSIHDAEGIKEFDVKDGVGVEKVEQTVVSADDDGVNVYTVTLTDGTQTSLRIKNGSKGRPGDKGDALTYEDLTDEQKAEFLKDVYKKADTYSKKEVDNKFGEVYSKNEVYNKEETYSKDDIDHKLISFMDEGEVNNLISHHIGGVVDNAPDTLNTLNKVANAVGDDPNFATTVMQMIGEKANKDHTHNLANYTTLDNASFEGRTSVNGVGGTVTADTLTAGGHRTIFEIKCIGDVVFDFGSSDVLSFFADGVDVKSQITEVEGITGVLRWQGKVNESIRIALNRNGTLIKYAFQTDEYTNGFINGERLKKLDNAPTTEDVHNIVNEAFGTVEAVFDEVHEYAESLGGDEA